MASNNPAKDLILTLFPDNNTQEISAADMRIFVHSIFNTKEEIITKATDEQDMKSKNTRIYENSVVLITHADTENGVYISRVNNPISLLQLDKVADLSQGSTVPGTALSDFMIEYTHNKSYLDAVYSYISGNISNIKLKDQSVDIYDINFTYTSGNITQTAIQEINSAVQVLINFTYTSGNITQKTFIL